MMTLTSDHETLTLAPTKAPIALADAWAQLRKVEPLGWAGLHYTVCSHPTLTQSAVAASWGTSPTRVRREINVGLGWLALWTGLEATEILATLPEIGPSDLGVAPVNARHRNG